MLSRANLQRRLAAIAQAKRGNLQHQWLDVFGSRPPKRLSTALLVLALSYHAQADKDDGLRESECAALGLPPEGWLGGSTKQRRRRNAVSASSTPRRSSACNAGSDASRLPRIETAGRADEHSIGCEEDANHVRETALVSIPRPSPRPVRRSIKPGTRLLRQWQGQTHEVVADGSSGFIYRGQTYGSLSAVARLITGTRWSGPTFFGIATKAQADRSVGQQDA
ncbi:MAG: DUF2924 domain-containing protein [Rhizobiales bacterium]|nr:DUF2924 domain-containing protein [Hyphomicrobiales bacterium]MBO6737915.1 DUF2924 domain-containing protein [Hyphomicrobiales bacterium]MBO6954327.1 DUF2924 domain-containing protein [Hyphomicrobiales bacterium]